MLTATILFILVNIPLSAYETVQEFTYFPNASAPAPPLSGLVPPSLRHSTNKFSPQHLDVGHSFYITIVSAFDSVENGRPVTSFPYSNNPFSNGCDVVRFPQAADLFQYYDYSVSGFITCTNPTLFEMGWNFNGGRLDTGISPSLLDDFRDRTCVVGSHVDFTANFTGQAYIRVTARPCCNCTPDLTSDALEQDQLHLAQEPCRSEPNADPRTQQGYIGINDLSIIYHVVRRDLGVIYNNQIFGSADMFNQSIVPVDIPDNTDRVPVLEYLRPVPRRKALGSAIVSVFVATFTMLSAIGMILRGIEKTMLRFYGSGIGTLCGIM
ncbi:hypothetical protein R3P38DRAFT_3337146 [Favolaschia claudopus]|uniref:Uncharacterized protein n=1 Tax=Favolaschia claudopus TaxID=2862362 RepID=A0AAV9Z2I2_9AGAR